MPPTTRKLAPLLFGSGMCALIYQIAWFREFRMVFGASTAATAAVLAIFIAGLGAGGFVLGGRADRHARPVLFYGQLEMLIAILAAITPALLWLVRLAYIGFGGTPKLGLFGGTAVRLVLSVLVLGAPTFLMGGTLPAAARGVEADDDLARRNTGLLYGVNTLGAVAGCSIATFFMLERYGTRMTLWIACVVNLLVALVAQRIGRRAPPVAAPDAATDTAPKTDAVGIAPAPEWFSLAAAGIVGFAFFLM